MAVLVGSARIDENGKISGGEVGDQTGREVATQNWYLHKKGWVVIRAKSSSVRAKIAAACTAACANNKIGYDQSNRYGLYNAVKNKGFNPANCTVYTEVDCSGLVRVCCCYAGIIVGDFNTSSEVSVLKATGKFDILTDSKYTESPDYLCAGDILVTKEKGHTVIVINNGPKVPSTVTTSTNTNKDKIAVALPTLKKGDKRAQVSILQKDLNYVIKAGLTADGIFGNKTEVALKKFQKKYGLTVDGIYGRATYNKMKSLI